MNEDYSTGTPYAESPAHVRVFEDYDAWWDGQGTQRKSRLWCFDRPEIRALIGAGQQIGDFMWKLTMSKTRHHGLALARP